MFIIITLVSQSVTLTSCCCSLLSFACVYFCDTEAAAAAVEGGEVYKKELNVYFFLSLNFDYKVGVVSFVFDHHIYFGWIFINIVLFHLNRFLHFLFMDVARREEFGVIGKNHPRLLHADRWVNVCSLGRNNGMESVPTYVFSEILGTYWYYASN